MRCRAALRAALFTAGKEQSRSVEQKDNRLDDGEKEDR